MPYDVNNPATLPKNVQTMHPDEQKQWVDIFNQTHAKYGDEAKSFKYANGVLKKRKQNKGFADGLDHPNDILKEFALLGILDEINIEQQISEGIGREVIRK